MVPILGNAWNVRCQNELHAASGLDRDRRKPVQVMAENLLAARRGLLRDALSKSVPGRIRAGRIADLSESRDRTDNGGHTESLEIVPIHLTRERGCAYLVKAGNLVERQRVTVRHNDPVKRDGQAALISAVHALR